MLRFVTKVALCMAALLVAVAIAAAYRHFVLVRPLLLQVQEQLTDPESAQFRNLRLFSTWSAGGGILCGEVNAKNRLGGYVGFRHFQAGLGPVEIESQEVAGAKDAAGIDHCDYASEMPWWSPPV